MTDAAHGRDSWRPHALVGTGFVLITLIRTWPLALRLSRVLPNDLGDPVLNTWILWWNAHAVPLTRGWWDAPMFFPTRGAMAFSETLLGLSWIASPLQWLGATPVAAYNVLFLLSFPLSAFTAYLLAWTLTRRGWPSVVAGVLYGYATFRFAHLGHLQILWSWWMPLVLLGLHRWMATARRSGLVLFGIAWLGESLSNGYYFFYFSIIVAIWIVWFTRWRDGSRRMLAMLLPVVVTWTVAIACLAPVLLTYVRVQEANRFHRAPSEIDANGADLIEFFTTSPAAREERNVFIGFAATGLLIAGIAFAVRDVARGEGRSPLVFYTFATIVGLVMAMGPTPRVAGVPIVPSGPYAWLMAIVPGFTGVRVPARFTLVAILCLANVAGLLLARLSSDRPARQRPERREPIVCGAIALIALIEIWPRAIPLEPLPPLIDPLAFTPHVAAVLELPVGENQEFPALYRAMFHRHPLVNGYSGYTPASYDALRLCLARKDAHCLTPIRQAGSIDVLIDREHDPTRAWELFVSQLPDAQFRYHTRQFTVFHLDALR